MSGSVQSMRALAGLGLGDRDVVLLRKGQKLVLGLGIEHAAARDDHRLFRRLHQRDDIGDLARIGFGPADAPDMGCKKALRIIIGLGLHVLAEGRASPARNRPGRSSPARPAAAPSECVRAAVMRSK